MKILVAGFAKTGTKSMNVALTQLGYKIYDFDHNFYYLGKQWIKIFNEGGTKEDFYEMYKDVDGTVDIPPCMFWEEILEAFPDVKIIFMRRKSEEDWMISWDRQARNIEGNYQLKVLSCLSPTARGFVRYSQQLARVVLCAPPQRFYQLCAGISPTIAKKRYRDHNTSVLTRAPKDQLLEFSLADGWEPLCKFLGKDVPNVPFPHKNKMGTVIDDLMANSPVFMRMKQEMKVLVSGIVVLAGVTIFAYLKCF